METPSQTCDAQPKKPMATQKTYVRFGWQKMVFSSHAWFMDSPIKAKEMAMKMMTFHFSQMWKALNRIKGPTVEANVVISPAEWWMW